MNFLEGPGVSWGGWSLLETLLTTNVDRSAPTPLERGLGRTIVHHSNRRWGEFKRGEAKSRGSCRVAQAASRETRLSLDAGSANGWNGSGTAAQARLGHDPSRRSRNLD